LAIVLFLNEPPTMILTHDFHVSHDIIYGKEILPDVTEIGNNNWG